MNPEANRIPRLNREDLIAVAVLFFAALGIRLVKLFSLDLWFDEVVLLFQVKMSYAEIWKFCQNENFPPLFPWLLKAWYGIFPGENSLRFLCALMGALTPPAAYFLGKEIQDRRLGWVLGLACVISVALIYYAQMIRMYALLPFLGCLSIIGFLRGLKSNRWQPWIFTAAVNLIGFYIFLFFLFLMAAQFLALAWIRRHDLKLMARPLLAHLPAWGAMLFWVGVMLRRYQDVKESFLGLDLTKEFSKLWVFFGTAKIDFGESYLAVILLNLPFLLGVIAAFIYARKQFVFPVLISLIFWPIALAAGSSLSGQSIFFTRYFLFLLPVYFTLALIGWASVPGRRAWRIGVSSIFLSLIFSSGYYFYEYLPAHWREHKFLSEKTTEQTCGGHGLSQLCDTLRRRVGSEEVVIHCSTPLNRIFTFFPAIYYNNRTLREYLYARAAIPNYFGRQYLHQGDQLHSLADLHPLPRGIWLITADPPCLITDLSVRQLFAGRNPELDQEDLPQQMIQAGYTLVDTFSEGRMTALHYLKDQ